MHLKALYRKNIIEQLLVSLGNFLFVWNSRVFVPDESQAFLLAVYTLTISFFPLYFALYIQPVRKLYYAQLVGIGYLRFLAILVSASVTLFVLLGLPFYSGLLSSSQDIFAAIFFAASYFAVDIVRRFFLLESAFPLLLLISSGVLALLRSSASLTQNVYLFLVLNIAGNFLIAFLLLSFVCSKGLRNCVSCESGINIFMRCHFPSLRLFAPLGLASFVVGAFPMFYSASLAPSFFVYFSRVRSLFSVLNPAFEYLDGSYFLRKSYPTHRESVRSVFSALGVLAVGIFVSLLSALCFYYSSRFRFFVIGNSDLSASPPFFLASLLFVLSLSAFIAFTVRPILVLIRRYLLHDVELKVLLSSLPCLLLVLIPAAPLNVALLYLLLSVIHLIVSLYFVLKQIARTAVAS